MQMLNNLKVCVNFLRIMLLDVKVGMCGINEWRIVLSLQYIAI